MAAVIVTYSCGLIGSEAVRFFAGQGLDVHGVDNDMRHHFFGSEALTQWHTIELGQTCAGNRHHSLDTSNINGFETLCRDGEITRLKFD